MNKFCMTPLQLKVLLHCHLSIEEHPDLGIPVYKEAHEKLYEADLLTFSSSGTFTTSLKGQVYVEHLLSTPLPVPKWERGQ